MFIEFIIFALIAFVSPQVIPGVKVKGIGAAVLVALVFSVLNLVVGWLLTLLVTLISLPLTCLSFGLFKLLIPTVIFAILLKVTDALLEPFELKGWWPAFGMGLLFSVGRYLVSFLS